jgi:hypothetical protein
LRSQDSKISDRRANSISQRARNIKPPANLPGNACAAISLYFFDYYGAARHFEAHSAIQRAGKVAPGSRRPRVAADDRAS